MTRHPRFELVRTNAGHHARFRGANGQVVWTTEVYKRRRSAMRAVELLDSLFGFSVDFVDIREVDER